MDVFLAGIIQGSLVEPEIHDQSWRDRVRRAIEQGLPGANVYCHYTRHPRSITYDLPRIRETLGEGIGRAAACDLLIAYLPGASMGTAIEMYEASRNGAAVWTVSPLRHNWVLRAFSDRLFETLDELEAFLASPYAARAVSGGAGR